MKTARAALPVPPATLHRPAAQRLQQLPIEPPKAAEARPPVCCCNALPTLFLLPFVGPASWPRRRSPFLPMSLLQTGDTYGATLMALDPFNGQLSDDGRGEHVFLTRVKRLVDIFLLRPVPLEVLRQAPSKELVDDTFRLMRLEQTYWKTLLATGGVLDTFEGDLIALHRRMESFKLSNPVEAAGACWEAGLVHVRLLLSRFGELRVVPLAAVQCLSCGSISPPAIADQTGTLCPACCPAVGT